MKRPGRLIPVPVRSAAALAGWILPAAFLLLLWPKTPLLAIAASAGPAASGTQLADRISPPLLGLGVAGLIVWAGFVAERLFAAMRGRRPWEAFDPATWFGPMFLKEVTVSGRRRAVYWTRGLYALLLLIVLLITFWGFWESMGYGGAAVRAQGLAHLAPLVARTVGWLQFVTLTILGPLLTATAISEERLHRTLPAHFTTPVSSFQIVFGKLASRLLQIVILGLIAVPVIMMLRVFGGYDARLPLAYGTLSIASAAFSASVALLLSVWNKRAWSVVILSGVIVAAVYAAPLVVAGAGTISGNMEGAAVAFVFASLLPPLPMFLITVPEEFAAALGSSAVVPLWVTPSVVTLGLAAVCATAAALVLRRSVLHVRAESTGDADDAGGAAGETAPADAPRGRSRARRRRRPRASRSVWDQPVLWRERRTMLLGSKPVAIVLGLLVVGFLGWMYWNAARWAEYLHYIVVGCLGPAQLLAACMMTTGMIPAEREARTWDVLLTTPLTARQIIYSKLGAGMLRAMLVPALLFVHFAVYTLKGDIRPASLLQLVALFTSYTFALAATGLLWGVFGRRAITASVLNLLLVLGAWLALPILSGIVFFGILDSPGTGIMEVVLFPNAPYLIIESIRGGVADAYTGDYDYADNGLSTKAFTLLAMGSSLFAVILGVFATAAAVVRLKLTTFRAR